MKHCQYSLVLWFIVAQAPAQSLAAAEQNVAHAGVDWQFIVVAVVLLYSRRKLKKLMS